MRYEESEYEKDKIMKSIRSIEALSGKERENYFREREMEVKERKMKHKIESDGFYIEETYKKYSITKDDIPIDAESICDLFEKIYGSREYNKDLKPIKRR